jgi:hypothetical protein
MAKWVLLNTTHTGRHTHVAGKVFDDVLEAIELNQAVSAGGQVYPQGANATIDAASAMADMDKRRGDGWHTDSLMLATAVKLLLDTELSVTGSPSIDAVGGVLQVAGVFLGTAIRLTGEDQRVQVQAAIDAASAMWAATGVRQTVRLGRGVLRVSEPGLRWRSGVTVDGNGEVTIKPTAGWSPGAGLVDDRRNFLCRGEGDVDVAKMNTVLTTAITPGGVAWYGAGARKMSVASTGTLAASDFFAVEGHESGDGSTYGGAGVMVVCCEILRASAIEAGPPRITLASPTKQHHVTDNHGIGVPLSVRALTPFIDAEVRGITFDADGKLFAVGVLLDRVVDVKLTNCAFRGFTKWVVDSFGSSGLRFDDCVLLGSNSGGINLESAIDCRIDNMNCMAHEARFHPASTFIRNAVRVAGWSTHVHMQGGLIQHMCSGVKWECFRACSMDGVHIDDMDIRPKMLLDSEEHVGVGIDMGVIDLSYANFAGPLNITNCMVTNCRQDATMTGADANGGVWQCYSAWLHDVYGLNINGLTVENTGLSPYTTIDGDGRYLMTGVGSQDCQGCVVGLKVKGCEVAFGYHSAQGLVLVDYDLRAVPGSGSNPATAMFFNSNTLSTLHMRGGRIQGGIYFGPDFATPVVGNTIEMTGVDFDDAGYFAGPLLISRNSASAVGTRTIGDVVVFDPATSINGVRRVDIPSVADAAHALKGIVAMSASNTIAANGWLFVVPANTKATCNVSGAVSVGDQIVKVNGQDWGVVDNTPGVPRLGQAFTSKGAGVGAVQIGVPQ